MKTIVNRVFVTRAPGSHISRDCTVIKMLSSYTLQEFWTPPPCLPTETATAARPAPIAANDNKPIAHRKAPPWPALQRARNGKLFGDDRDPLAAAVLEGFARLYCESALDPEAIPSSAGKLLDLSIGVADLPEGARGQDGAYSNVDRRLERSAETEAELIMRLHGEGRLRIASHGYDYLTKRGEWRRLPLDVFKQPRGTARKASKPLTVQPSQAAAAPRTPSTPQLDRLIAMEAVEEIRRRLDTDSWAGLVAIAVDKATARQLGEREGLTFKRAEARGGELMREYTAAAIAAFELPEPANEIMAWPLAA